jgi:hypothetical protein
MSESQSAPLSQSDLLLQQINWLINDDKNFNILKKMFEINKPLITPDLLNKINIAHSKFTSFNNGRNKELLKVYGSVLKNSTALAPAPAPAPETSSLAESVFKFVVHRRMNGEVVPSNDLALMFIKENVKDINFNNMSNEYLNDIICRLFTNLNDKFLFDIVIQLKHFRISQENIKCFKNIYKYIIYGCPYVIHEDNVLLLLMDYFRDCRTLDLSKRIIPFLEKNNFKNYAEFEKLFIESEYFEFKESREIFKEIIQNKHKISKDIIDRRLALLNDKIKNELLEVID